MIRKLYLQNKSGEVYYFDYRSATLISNLDGLGFEHDLTYLKYGNVYDRVDRASTLTEIKATLTFLKGYRGYTSFLEYLKGVDDEFTLYYGINEFKYCKVDIKSISKSEIAYGVLQCGIIFNKLSPWLKEKVVSIEANGDSTGKVYPFTYPYTYSKSYEGRINISNTGITKAPLKVEIYPEVNILKNNEIISKLKLYLESDDCLITVSADSINQFMQITESGITRNIYENQDFTCDNFLFLEPGEYLIEFKPGVASVTNCRITLTEGYLGT